MSHELIDRIAAQSAENLKTLFGELSDDIETAIIAVTEQAQIDEKEIVKLTLSHSIVIDLVKHTQEDNLAVSVRHKASLCGFMPDPNQPELDLDGKEAV
jgi:hypothetical protein